MVFFFWTCPVVKTNEKGTQTVASWHNIHIKLSWKQSSNNTNSNDNNAKGKSCRSQQLFHSLPVCQWVWGTLPNHMLCLFSNREEEKEPLAQGFGHQVMRFLLHDLGVLHKTPVTLSFEHSVVLFPWPGFCSTFPLPQKVRLGPSCASGAAAGHNRALSVGQQLDTLPGAPKLLQGCTRRGELPSFSPQQQHCQEAEMTQWILNIVQRYKIHTQRPCAPVILEQLPVLQWGFLPCPWEGRSRDGLRFDWLWNTQLCDVTWPFISSGEQDFVRFHSKHRKQVARWNTAQALKRLLVGVKTARDIHRSSFNTPLIIDLWIVLPLKNSNYSFSNWNLDLSNR